MTRFFNPRGIRFRLVAWNAATLAILLGAMGLASRYATREFMMGAAERELERQSRPPNRGGGGGPPPPGGGESFFDAHPAPPSDANAFRPMQFDHDGVRRADERRQPWDPQAVAATRREGRSRYTQALWNGDTVLVYTAPTDYGFLQAARSLTDVHLALASIDRTLIVLLPFGLLAAIGAGFLVTHKVLGVVNRTAETVDRIDPKDLSARLPIDGDDEFTHLARTFNSLLDRTESAFRNQARMLDQLRRFTADASHELKTPLTVIRGAASLALNGQYDVAALRTFFETIQSSSVSMTALVQDLLLLARSDEGKLGHDRHPLFIAEILDAAAAQASRTAPEPRPIQTSLADAEEAMVHGNRSELQRLFSNLIENAIRYSNPGAPIEIACKAEGSGVLVTIADHGAGIAPEHLPLLGQRFYRVDASRSRASGGSGLGLSICKGIVDAHGGTLSIASKLGVGSTVTIKLPALS